MWEGGGVRGHANWKLQECAELISKDKPCNPRQRSNLSEFKYKMENSPVQSPHFYATYPCMYIPAASNSQYLYKCFK